MPRAARLVCRQSQHASASARAVRPDDTTLGNTQQGLQGGRLSRRHGASSKGQHACAGQTCVQAQSGAAPASLRSVGAGGPRSPRQGRAPLCPLSLHFYVGVSQTNLIYIYLTTREYFVYRPMWLWPPPGASGEGRDPTTPGVWHQR